MRYALVDDNLTEARARIKRLLPRLCAACYRKERNAKDQALGSRKQCILRQLVRTGNSLASRVEG